MLLLEEKHRNSFKLLKFDNLTVQSPGKSFVDEKINSKNLLISHVTHIIPEIPRCAFMFLFTSVHRFRSQYSSVHQRFYFVFIVPLSHNNTTNRRRVWILHLTQLWPVLTTRYRVPIKVSSLSYRLAVCHAFLSACSRS